MVFDYDFLREAYDLSLETDERAENEIPKEEIQAATEPPQQKSIRFNA
jgi:hypothetical protein